MKLLLQILLLLLLCFPTLIKAQNVRLYGNIYDKTSGETLIGANITAQNSDNGTVTNSYGFYSLNLKKGTHELVISYIGYQKQAISLNIQKDTSLNFSLNIGIELKEVTVSAKIDKGVNHGALSIPIEKLKSIPTIAGEPDAIKALALLPGVATGTEGTAGLYVRGGTPDQNLILLDGATVYNTSHLFGFLSVINPTAIKSINLIKGAYPAQFGGRLASVIDINTKEGNNQEYKGEFSLGLINSNLAYEGPIKKGKSSFMVSARTAYLGIIALSTYASYKKGTSDNYGGFLMYDFNAKANFELSKTEKLYFSTYFGDDDFFTYARNPETDKTLTTVNKTTLLWGNKTASMRYTKILRPNLFAHAMLNFNQFNYLVKAENLDYQNNPFATIKNNSKVKDYAAKLHFDWNLDAFNQIKFGAEAIQHEFTPNFTVSQTGERATDSIINTRNLLYKPYTLAAYIEDNIRLSKYFEIKAGLRLVNYHTEQSNFKSLEPRLSLQVNLPNESSLQVGYTRMTQFIHLLNTSGVGFSNDIWVPATKAAPPSEAIQYSLSYSKDIKEYDVQIQAETFYKTMNHQLDFRQGSNFFIRNVKTWEETVERNGIGKVYGFELLVKHQNPLFSGWASYTWSKNERQFATINDGAWYPHRYDRRHNLSLTGEWKLNDTWKFSSNFVFQTGNAITMPEGVVTYPTGVGTGYWAGQIQYNTIVIYKAKNNQRMPNYHRLDVGFVKTYTNKWQNEAKWSFNVYNVYAKANPYAIEYFPATPDQQGIFTPSINSKSIFRFIPGFNYSVKFGGGKKVIWY